MEENPLPQIPCPVITPDGLIIHISGPVDGRRYDETVYKESGLSDLLDKHFWTPEGQSLYIYSDPAYSEPIEWLFKEVSQKFMFLDFSRNQKTLLTLCGHYYLVSLLLCNAHTILHYPEIPQYFSCLPPSLEEYFHGGPIEDDELDAWCLDSVWKETEVEIEEGEDEIEDADDSDGMDTSEY
ncbi:hypothetical protein M422DRAFT_261692 [Sphaerobolus stellatus SS14]|uniref:DDE Tnp4 domain-containing protein n=1 Tax=Sphaerobolus stellatus (strain SS14) TaxID=990650 RepID=A0A0C9UM93_SPHS4|nr:hypothetical protein M422DRAFT_261692 [Sphaerobolus stellatus SS14]